MSEMGEMPHEFIEEESLGQKAVNAVRSGVRKGLETNSAYHDWLNEQKVNKGWFDGFFKVYTTWDEARQKVVDRMSDADRNSLETAFYELKMKLGAAGLWSADFVLKVASKALVVGGGIIVGGSIFSGVGLPGVGVGVGVTALGAATEHLRKKTELLGKTAAWGHAFRKTQEYSWRQKQMLKREAPKAVKNAIGEKVNDILYGFAYKDIKPVKPSSMKM